MVPRFSLLVISLRFPRLGAEEGAHLIISVFFVLLLPGPHQ